MSLNVTDTKYLPQLESQSDLLIVYPICRATMPIFRWLRFTPNGITTLSLISMLIAIYYLYIDTRIASVFFISSYIFDCADGMFARKYNLTSAFGMAYDYTKDTLVCSTFYIAATWRYIQFLNLNVWQVFLVASLVMYLALMWLGVNEAVLHYNKYGNTNFFKYRKSLLTDQKIWGKLFTIITNINAALLKPYLRDIETMIVTAKVLSIVSMGNLFMAVFILMNVVVIK